MNPLPADAIPTLTDILEAGRSPRVPTLTDVLVSAPAQASAQEFTARTIPEVQAVSAPVPGYLAPALTEKTTSSVETASAPVPSTIRPQPESHARSNIDREELEARLLRHLSERFQATLEARVHTSVAPAVSMLADRIAYKAAQEVAADLAARMQDDLRLAIRQALDALNEAPPG